ncbi:hypothetical protein AB0M20_16655 [Actinoplanes sp. NPDC051633]|uniref:hypothetical protein n=1 Tax=Actinoplanes sp. NPDC051633 TaxID=3155670 RepID=UPI00341DE499
MSIASLVAADRAVAAAQGAPLGWEATLRAAVRSGFLRRPWDGRLPAQGISDLVEEIAAGPVLKLEVSEVRARFHGTLGVVMSSCTWPDLGDDSVQVVRVYSLQERRWLCEYWQETRYTRPRW